MQPLAPPDPGSPGPPRPGRPLSGRGGRHLATRRRGVASSVTTSVTMFMTT
jgi:hypothetical protein